MFIAKNLKTFYFILYSYSKNMLVIYNKSKYIKIFLRTNKIYLSNKNIYLPLSPKTTPNYTIMPLNKKKKSLVIIKKLNLVGIGFKASVVNINNHRFIQLKLGYSHDIYLKIPSTIRVYCPNPSKVILLGSSYSMINNFVFKLRFFKKPDSYKGKGILFFNQIIKLKTGKKT